MGASRSGTAHRELFDWPIFLDLMEYTNQIQKLTERSVSDYAFGYTQCNQKRDRSWVAKYQSNMIRSCLKIWPITLSEFVYAVTAAEGITLSLFTSNKQWR